MPALAPASHWHWHWHAGTGTAHQAHLTWRAQVRNKDIEGTRKEAFVRLPCFAEDWLVQNMLEDPRDAVMASLIVNILCTTVPLTVLLWHRPSHLLGACSMGFSLFMYMQRFILMMHYAEHRKLFKKPYARRPRA